jgi:hypothetical protein
MKIIAVAGATSKAGKTLLAEQIIRYCAEKYSPVYAVKFTTTSDLPSPCPRGAPCTVCDLSDRFRIVRDPQTLLQPGKNTQRLKAAGANEVLWVISKKSQIANAYAHLLEHLPPNALTIMEGSTITFLSNPDLLFYIYANHISPARWKDSAEALIGRADFVVINRKSKLPDHPEVPTSGKAITIDLSQSSATEMHEVRAGLDSVVRDMVLASR